MTSSRGPITWLRPQPYSAVTVPHPFLVIMDPTFETNNEYVLCSFFLYIFLFYNLHSFPSPPNVSDSMYFELYWFFTSMKMELESKLPYYLLQCRNLRRYGWCLLVSTLCQVLTLWTALLGSLTGTLRQFQRGSLDLPQPGLLLVSDWRPHRQPLIKLTYVI